MSESQVEKNQTQEQPKRGLGTGAKITLAALGILGALGTGIGATYLGIDLVRDYQEGKRAESLITYYMDEDQLVRLPGEVVIDKEYDALYCSGEKLVTELTESNAQYCYIDGQYYTAKGETIAILTLEVTRTEVIPAHKVEVGGNVVYMAPEGYELNGTECSRETVTIETKVVPKKDNNDYSDVIIEGATKAIIKDVQEVETKKYSSLNGYDLICDVDDAARFTENQCEAELVLKKR